MEMVFSDGKSTVPLATLKEVVFRHSGLKLDETRITDIPHILTEMCAWAGAPDFRTLLSQLESLPTHHVLWQRLLGRVTIGETYFFRDAAQIAALTQHVLPELINRRRVMGLRHLNIWSAGCASGEEAYTLSILLHELIPDIDDWVISIMATDINVGSLEIGRAGIYRVYSFRTETRPDVQARYFIQRGKDFELLPHLRKPVKFAPLNLVTDEYPSFTTRTLNMDLVICRNVTIYFDEATTRKVIGRFHQAINDNGWLVVGHSEPNTSIYTDFAPRNFEGAVLYQKTAEGRSQIPVHSPSMLDLAAQRAPVQVDTGPLHTAGTTPAKTEARTPLEPVRKAPIQAAQKAAPTPTIADVRAAVDREDWDTAMSMLVTLEKLQPMETRVHYLRGLVLMHSGELDAARQALRRSVYCDPNFALAHYILGEVHVQQGNHKEARRCWIISQRAVAGLGDQTLLNEGDDLTVEMFRSLINTRLESLPGS